MVPDLYTVNSINEHTSTSNLFLLQNLDKPGESRKYHRRQVSGGSMKYVFEGPMKRVYDSIEVVPTKEAEASR